MEARWRNRCCHGKPINIIYSECCAQPYLSSMQCACAILHCQLWPFWLYHIFPHYLTNGTIFRKKPLLNVKCVFWFSLQLLSETFLILRRTEWDIIKNVYRSAACKVPLFLLDFDETWILKIVLRTILKYQILWKSVQWETRCFMRTNRRTGMTKLIKGFRNSANVLNKVINVTTVF
jgi:hypothetical protein